ncbi:protein EVI2A [Sceloporus undulatus]|uniref:protein EVI2A n=1 Tax=Sceloporus undulatus TaxID=8520 RepID=UPI001C4B1DEF|nr:protein EVI2A [Sceloporus undulatus]
MKPMAKTQVYLGLLHGIILPFCLQVRVTATEDAFTTSPSVLTTQTPTDPSTTVVSQEILTTLASQETTAYTTQTTTLESTSPVQTTTPLLSTSHSSSPEIPTSPPLASTVSPDVLTSSSSATGTDQESVTLGDNQAGAELCAENNKRLMLICLIIIGLLVFLCVCLLLVIVILASKLSYIKRGQTNRRLPRSNGDFLTTKSLWPAGLETLQRMTAEATETSLAVQGPGPERIPAGQGKVGEETSRRLASEISIRQKHKEMSPKETSAKPQNSTLTKVEV